MRKFNSKRKLFDLLFRRDARNSLLFLSLTVFSISLLKTSDVYGKNIYEDRTKKELGRRTIDGENFFQRAISGTVTNADGEPLVGVTVSEQGTNNVTQTGNNGSFTVMISSLKPVLLFSSVGYNSKSVEVGENQKSLEVTLERRTSSLDEVVVVGYGTQKKVDITGAIDVVDPTVLDKGTASNPLTALQGRAPGAYITTSGAPGASPSVIIRGLSTLGSHTPLYIIDGVPTENGIGNIEASNIANIQILKDAAAASIYGSRASNGVIIIETKKASNKSLTFDSRITTQKYLGTIKVLDTDQRGKAYWQAYINEGRDPNIDPIYKYEWHTDNVGNPILDKVNPIEWINEDMGIKSANTDWYKEVTRRGLISRNQVTLSTKSESGGARLSVTHYNDKGVVIFNKYNEINFELNSNYKIGKNIEIGENLIITSSTNYPEHALGGALTIQSIIPVHTEDGGWGGPWGAGFEDWLQPVMTATIDSWDNIKTNRVFGSGYLAINILPNLRFKSTVGIENLDSRTTDYQRPYESGFLHRTTASLGINENNTFNWSLSNTLTYDLNLGNHGFNILGGTDLYKNTNKTLNTFADNFAIDQRDYYQMSAASGTQTITGSGTGYQLASFFGKINYNFSQKYLLSATLRYDGSSRFGKENRFGTFPSLSVGWRLDEEEFMKSFKNINLLKPRFGRGVVGNQSIQNDAAIALYQALYGMDYTWVWDQSTSYDLNGVDAGNLPSGFRRLKAGNDRLKWETTTENNFGIDYGFFDARLTGSFDYYVRKSKDILIQPPYLGAIGEGGNRWLNGASVENKGWEFSVSYNNSIKKDIFYQVSLNLGHFKDKITFLPPDVVKAYPGNVEKTILGHSQSAIFGYVVDGLFQNQDEVDKHAVQVGKDIGRIRYKDLNNDGVIDALDQDYIGNTLPALIYGINLDLTYKQWNISVFANGEVDKSIYNTVKQNTDFIFSRAGINYGVRVLDAWTPQNPGSTIPALITSNKNNEYRSSTYFVESGSYWKLRNVEVNYNFKNGGFHFLNRLRVFLIGENLLLVKSGNYTGPDPEAPNNGYGRPLKITFGLNVSL